MRFFYTSVYLTRKTPGTVENPACQQILLFEIRIIYYQYCMYDIDRFYNTQHFSDFDFDLLRSLNVKCDGAIGLWFPINI